MSPSPLRGGFRATSQVGFFDVGVVLAVADAELRGSLQQHVEDLRKEDILSEENEIVRWTVEFVDGLEALQARVAGSATSPGPSCTIAVSDGFAETDAQGRAVPVASVARLRELRFDADRPLGLVFLDRSGARRVLDVDRTVPLHDLDGEVERLREALRLTARGLRLKLPPRQRSALREDEAVRVHLADTCEELVECFRLRHRIYDLMGYLEPEVSESLARTEIDSFDQSALHLAARLEPYGELVGTARLILPEVSPRSRVFCNPARATLATYGRWTRQAAEQAGEPFRTKVHEPYLVPLPIYQSSQFRGRWSHLQGSGKCSEISRVVVTPEARGLGISRLLVRGAVALALRLGGDRILLECIPAHVGMYERCGFKRLAGSHVRAQELDQIAIGMELDLRASEIAAPAIGLGQRDLDFIEWQPGVRIRSGGPKPLVRSRHLCLCERRNCWENSGYRLRRGAACPLRTMHHPERGQESKR